MKKLKYLITAQVLFWSKHIVIAKAIIIGICILPLVDIQKILSFYMKIFEIANNIAKTIAFPIAIITIISSVIYTIIYIKNTEEL